MGRAETRLGSGSRAAARITRLLGAGACMGGAALAWGLVEAEAYVLRSRTVAVEWPRRAQRAGEQPKGKESGGDEAGYPGHQPLRVLHLSDLHLTARNRRRSAWTASLARLEPDLIVATGDFIAAPDALDILARTLAPFEGTPGVFVYGSNDYFAPRPRNPFDYLKSDSRPGARRLAQQDTLPTAELTALLEGLGWLNLNNARGRVHAAGWTIDCVGVDDPHIDRDAYPGLYACGVERVADAAGKHANACGGAVSRETGRAGDNQAGIGIRAGADLRVGVTHAPYVRVLDEMAADGCELIFAGHTHGGQLGIPGYGAIITNSDLPRQFASGTFAWPAGERADVIRYDGGLATRPGSAAVTVSAGLGTSPYVPIRINRRPEAVLLNVVAA
ncbi:metallophosphoesterase [Neoactinobaculum massilliense]|uniref:metallophosphoesterase n=1 Tax=Neoactinobaculum massilliense TaxID=2364794 RepID=UPI0019CFA638|nr:metallophosphoesterase [Neoactinobaculum massilliense]